MKNTRTTPDTTARKPGPFKPKPTPPKASGRNGTPPGKPRPATKEAPPSAPSAERVNAAGLVHIADDESVKALPIYYNAELSKWYGPNGQGGFSRLSDGHAKSLIAEHGFNKSFKDPQGNTTADRAMLYVIQHSAVAYAGALAGYRAGCHETACGRILVTESPRLIEPRPGDWPVIRRLIETQLADEGQPQVAVFYTLVSASFRAFWQRMTEPGPWEFRYCPALAIFGPKECGKTALIELVLQPLFGGRKGKPMKFLREGKFNKDLFGAGLLVMDDEGASANLPERRQRGEAIKNLIWQEEQRLEGKGADALMLRPFWRLVIAGNDDDSGLQVCPALSPGLDDKLIILKARKAEGLPTTNEENSAWTEALRRELPAFAAFLLGYHPPDELELNKRSRVALLRHPDLLAALRDMQPEMRLLELIDSLSLLEGADKWEGSATDFERALRGKDSSGMLDRIFTNQQAAGRMLTELADHVAPTRVTKTNWGGTSHYRIFPPKTS